jgi:hypothetical protein
VTVFAVPTCNRVPQLVACLESFVANFRRYGRRPEIVVADDARDREGRAATLQALRTFRGANGETVRYIGLDE